MRSPAAPPDEDARLAALQSYDILDTLAEAAFDDLVLLGAAICGTPIAFVSLLDQGRVFAKAAFGTERSDVARDVSFCAHAVHEEGLFVVPDTHLDPRFADNPLVTGPPHLRFYAGAPLRTPAGHALGTFCVLDRVPRALTATQRQALEALARQTSAQLELRATARRLEAAARVARRYELLSTRTRDIILFVALDGRILDANAAALQAYGYDRAQLTTLRIEDLRAPATRSTAAVMLAQAREGAGGFETLHCRRDGEVFPVEVSVQPADDGEGAMLISIIRDISERRAAENALRLRDRALAANPTGLTIADARVPDLPLLYVNAAFERISGYAAEELLGRNCRFLQGAASDQPALADIREALRTGGACQVVLSNTRKDGTLFWNDLTIAPVHDEHGTLTHFIGAQVDVTGRVQAKADETALADLRARQTVLLEQALAQRSAQLLRADRLATLGTLAAGVGHELNNIPQILKSYLCFVRDRCVTGMPPEDEDLTALERASEHVRMHAAHLLALGRPGPDHAEAVDLREVVTATLAMLAAVGKTRRVKIAVLAPDVPVTVTVNRTRIEQVLVNLVGNAVDALAELRDRPTVRVVIEAESGATGRRRVRCRVEDNGPGMSADTLGQIFEPYFTTKPVGKGTGLGLPVVRQIVEAYGGALSATSREGEGTTFTFDLPVETLETAEKTVLSDGNAAI